jgi:hypothetical protein
LVNGLVSSTGVSDTAGQVDVYGTHSAGIVVPHAGEPVCLHELTHCPIVTFLQ